LLGAAAGEVRCEGTAEVPGQGGVVLAKKVAGATAG
jgi:hypothetical protein